MVFVDLVLSGATRRDPRSLSGGRKWPMGQLRPRTGASQFSLGEAACPVLLFGRFPAAGFGSPSRRYLAGAVCIYLVSISGKRVDGRKGTLLAPSPPLHDLDSFIVSDHVFKGAVMAGGR